MRNRVYVLVFEGFADWQVALALSEVTRPGDWEIATLGFTAQPVLSMSGLRVVPDVSIAAWQADAAALLIVPGSRAWERARSERIAGLAQQIHAAGTAVAAIGDGVLALAHAGLLQTRRHTANEATTIAREVPTYRGADHYDTQTLAVSDDGVITASQFGSVEFAREIIRSLDLYSTTDREHWYRLFKHAIPLPWFRDEAAQSSARRTRSSSCQTYSTAY